MGRGKHIGEETKECVRKISKFFNKEKKLGRPAASFQNVNRRVSLALGLNIKSVYNILRTNSEKTTAKILKTNSTTKTKRNRKRKLNNIEEASLKKLVQKLCRTNQFISTNMIKNQLNNQGIKISKSTVCRTLKRLGFQYNQKNGKQFLKEQAHAVSTRQEFSRKIKTFREEGMKIVYVDETLINANHVAPGEWTENGLISGTNSIQPNPQEAETIDCFKCHGNNDDEMNIENFMEWFTHDFLPSQEEPSVIVLGNAQYHNAITEESKSPTSNNRKGEIIEWLVQRNIQFLPRHTKAELLDIVRLYKPEPVYITDIAAFEHGHQCLRVPVHHLYSELNPIKTAQAQKKRCVDQKNTSVKLPKQLSLEAKDKATDCLESPGNHTDMGQQQFWITDNLDVQEEEVSAAMNICVDESFTEEDDRSDSEEEQEECSTGNHGDDLLCTIREDDDGLCAVCNSQFPRSGNNAVVEWLYCDACDQWLHLECSGEVAVPDVDNYMCKRCSVDPGYSANFPSNPKVRVLTKRNI